MPDSSKITVWQYTMSMLCLRSLLTKSACARVWTDAWSQQCTVFSMVIAGLEVELDMIQPNANPAVPKPLQDRLKSAPGQLKELLMETVVVCAKNILAILKTHFPRIALGHADEGVAVDFDATKLPELAKEFTGLAKNIVKELDLENRT